MSADHASMLSLAARLAERAGDIATEHFGRVTGRRKADGSIVTDVDLAIQRMIEDGLAREYPNHALIAEETVEADGATADRDGQHHLGSNPASARYCWVVDPLDGTRNYEGGVPVFCTSIALLDRGNPVVGVVRDLMTGRSYTATRGSSTRVNDQPTTVSNRPLGGDSMVAVPSTDVTGTPPVIQRWFDTINLRNLGAVALHLALVAAGAFDAAIGFNARLWDVAAGMLLVTEAGGVCTAPDGGALLPIDLTACRDRDIPIVAAGGAAHRQVLERLAAISS